MRTEVIVIMEKMDNDAEVAQIYVLGDAAAGREVQIPRNEIRKLRKSGKLAGAFVKTGHRSILYHRSRLRQRVNDAFKTA
jgi:monoamine oxidase